MNDPLAVGQGNGYRTRSQVDGRTAPMSRRLAISGAIAAFGIVPAAPPLVAADAACGLGVEIGFVESAPRDRFELVNVSTGDVRVAGVALVLEGSLGALVFDTADGGTGVEMFQPFRIEEGDALLVGSVPPEDGGERVELAFEGFGPGERFVFSIDVDDRLARSELGQIRVAGGEIEGATVTVSATGPSGDTTVHSATFGADARAAVTGEPCAG